MRGESLEEIGRGQVNFYREVYFDEVNRALVEAAKRGDLLPILEHLMKQDLAHPEPWDDELFESRPGLQKILDLLRRETVPRDILDVACGNAVLLKRLRALGHRVVGIDASPVRVLLNRAEISSLYFGFCENMPIGDETVDIAIATETLEHVANLQRTLAELFRVLRPGGRVYAQVPDGTFADGVNHFRHFSAETLRYVFEQSGFSVEMLERIAYLAGEPANNLFALAVKVDRP